MATNEETLLMSFLIDPAPLNASLALEEFKSLFSKSSRQDASIPKLYRELKRQRAGDIQRVRQNVMDEVKRGRVQQRQIQRVREQGLQEELGDDVAELNLEAKLFPDAARLQQRATLSVDAVSAQLDFALEALEDDVKALEEEEKQMLQTIRNMIANMPSKDASLKSEVVKCLEQIK